MQKPQEGKYVNNTEAFNVAAHRIVMGHHRSLLVGQPDNETVGILRSNDLFNALYDMLYACTQP